MSGLSGFKLAIFDWAGTMVDFGCCAPTAAIRAAFAERGVDLSSEAVRADMGKAKTDHIGALLARADVRELWAEAVGGPPQPADHAAIIADLDVLMRKAAAEVADLIPGAAGTVAALRSAGVKVASSTGYTRQMMEPVLERAAAQGYRPDHVVCSGETLEGRPSPLMIYKACVDLGVWPLSSVVKIDDTPVGVQEGVNAGCLVVGVAASGNAVGLSLPEFEALGSSQREALVAGAAASLTAAGAHIVIPTVADLIPALQSRA